MSGLLDAGVGKNEMKWKGAERNGTKRDGMEWSGKKIKFWYQGITKSGRVLPNSGKEQEGMEENRREWKERKKVRMSDIYV